MKSEQKETANNSSTPKDRSLSLTPKAANLKNAEQEVMSEELTKREMEVITTVFKSFETGLREATILPKVIRHIMLFPYLYLCGQHKI